MSLTEISTDAGFLTSLEPEELGLRLFPILARPRPYGSPLTLPQFMHDSFIGANPADTATRERSAFPMETHEPLREAVAEAWAWLQGQGLIVPTLEAHSTSFLDFHPTNRQVSRKGRRFAAEPRLRAASRLLPQDVLHPLIRETVWEAFHRGRYGTAVFDAMKAVEIRVRDAAGLAATDYGTDLMRKAFKPEGGR